MKYSFILLYSLFFLLSSCKNKNTCKDVTCTYDACEDGKCQCEWDNTTFLNWKVECTPCNSENFSPSLGIRFNGKVEPEATVAFQFNDTIQSIVNQKILSSYTSYETFYINDPDAVISSGNLALNACEVKEILTVIE